MLTKLWQSQLRANLHNPDFWSSENASLLYVSTGAGFCGSEQLKAFCSAFPSSSHPFNCSDSQIQSISLLVDEQAGALSEEFVVSWTQQGVKLPWLLPSVSFPLRRFELPFTVNVQLCPKRQKLLNVRVSWDQAGLLKQLNLEKMISEFNLLSSREVTKRLVGPLSAELMNPLSPLPGPLKRDTSLNSLNSIIADLPAASELAVTPKKPIRSRSINPALLSSMRLGVEEDELPIDGGKAKLLTDSPAPAHVRAVKSRVFDQEPLEYRPLMSAGKDHNASNIFDSTPQSYQPILSDNKKRFESRVFESEPKEIINHVGNSQPSQESHFMAPEEDLKLGRVEGPNVTLARPQMQGHFKGAQLGETVPFINRKAASADAYDPNKSQIDFGVDENAPPASSIHVKGANFNHNRSQIIFDYDNPQQGTTVKPSSRVNAPPGGHSTIEL